MDQLNKMAEVIETVESIRRIAQLARDRAREQPGMEYYANTLNEIDRQAKMVAQQLSKREPEMVAQQPPRDNIPVFPRERDAQMVTQQPVRPTEEAQRLLDHAFLRWDYVDGLFIARSPDAPWAYVYGQRPYFERNKR